MKEAKNVGLNQEFNICGFYSIWDNQLGVKENISTSFKLLTGMMYVLLLFLCNIPACLGGYDYITCTVSCNL